ncbi:MAG: hypothetical protein AABM66_12160 [Actinomycetota bacterium]
MGSATLKVPPHHVEGFRRNVYASLAGEADTLEGQAQTLGSTGGEHWHKFIANDDPDKERDNIERYASGVSESIGSIAALGAAMDQLGWTDEIKDNGYELTGDPEFLRSLLVSYLIDLGHGISETMGDAPTKPQAIRLDMDRIEWCLAQQDALQAGAS